MEYFLSCVTVMKSNTKSSTVQASQTESFPGVAYFLVYRESKACNKNKIFALLHNASSVFQVLKDHTNEAVQNVVCTSNSYCFGQAAAELNREETFVELQIPALIQGSPAKLLWSTKTSTSCKSWMSIKSYNQVRLSAKIVPLLNAFQTCVPTNPSVITRTIKDIDRLMEVCGHALYCSKIYTCPNGVALTFVEIMDVDSYLHHLLSNNTLRKRVLKHFHVLSRILVHLYCTIIQQLVFETTSLKFWTA